MGAYIRPSYAHVATLLRPLCTPSRHPVHEHKVVTPHCSKENELLPEFESTVFLQTFLIALLQPCSRGYLEGGFLDDA